jgi:hypothetical protein
MTYVQYGGLLPETAALTNVLAASGLSLSEPMVFGISGGLGAGYILWEFKEHNIKILVLGFHNRWQYPIEYFQIMCDRLGVQAKLEETSSKKTAVQMLNDHLPAIAWVDRASLPYLQLSKAMEGHIGHIVAVSGRDSDDYLIDDLARQPFRISEEALTAARSRIGSYKNRLLSIERIPEAVDLRAAIMRGLEDCTEHLSSPSESFSLPTIRKWGKTMTDGKNKKGWLKVFEDRRGLYSTLRSIFESIEVGVAPGGLRGMYGDFLVEAAPIVDNPQLEKAAVHYHQLSEAWSALAEEALPDQVALFKEAKALMRERHRAFLEGGERWRETQSITQELQNISTQCNLEFPIDDNGIVDLFKRLQDHLLSLYEQETKALTVLKQAIER